MHPLIGNLCIRPEGGIDAALFEALSTRLSVDDAFDLAEIDEVGRAHRDAAHANVERAQARAAAQRRRRRGR